MTLFDLPFVWFNPKILFVVFAAISRSHRINKMLNCNQYVNIDMIPFMNTVASMMTTEHLFVEDGLFMSAHVTPSTPDFLSTCLYFYILFIWFLFVCIPQSRTPQSWQIIFHGFHPLIPSLNYSHFFRNTIHQPSPAYTTILATRALIINLYHIIIPLTAAHNIHILTVSACSTLSFGSSQKNVDLFTEIKILFPACTVQLLHGCRQKQLESWKPKPKLKIMLEGKSIRQHTAERARTWARKQFQFSSALRREKLLFSHARSRFSGSLWV